MELKKLEELSKEIRREVLTMVYLTNCNLQLLGGN